MLGWILRMLLVIAGSITGWFVARDALNFNIIQMVVAVILFTIAVMIATFWPELTDFFQRIVIRYKKH